MLLPLQLLSGRAYLTNSGKSFQMITSKPVQPTEVLLRVTAYKGALVLSVGFVMNTEQGMPVGALVYKPVVYRRKPSPPGPLLASI